MYSQIGVGISYIQPLGDRQAILDPGFSLDLNYDFEGDYEDKVQLEVFFRIYTLNASKDTFRGIGFSNRSGNVRAYPSYHTIENYRAVQTGLNFHYRLLDKALSPIFGGGLFMMSESNDFYTDNAVEIIDGNLNSIFFGAQPLLGIAYSQETFRIRLKSAYQLLISPTAGVASQILTSLDFCYYFDF